MHLNKKLSMRKVLLFLILSLGSLLSFSQSESIGAYGFVRIPHFVNYQFKSSEISYVQAISTGIGIYHKAKFLELGTFINEGDTYGFYTFFGSNLKSNDLGNSFKINTNWFGEVTNIPNQNERTSSTWIITSGVCIFPNIQIQKMNIGIPICFGLAHSNGNLSFDSRLILNLSFYIN